MTVFSNIELKMPLAMNITIVVIIPDFIYCKKIMKQQTYRDRDKPLRLVILMRTR